MSISETLRDTGSATLEEAPGAADEAGKSNPAAPFQQPAVVSTNLTVNVRFDPKGLARAIDPLPDGLEVQAWFDHLCRTHPTAFHPLSGGRGCFYLSLDEFEAARATCA